MAPNISVVLVGWCIAQLLFNALLAALVAVLPDQVPTAQRGLVSGVLGICLPIASVSGTFVVQLFTGNQLAMFLAPCAIGGFFVLPFVVTLKDRRLDKADRPAWSLREFASTFYVNPRKNPDFAWAFASRFLLVLAYAFLVTFQAYYLLDKIGSAEADVPQQIFLGTLVQSVVIVAASLIGGRLSDRTGRRKIFVLTASIVYGLAMFVVAVASSFNGFLVGMAIGGLGFGMYVAVDLALVADVLPNKDNAKDLGVFNIASALPFSIAPAIAPAILAIGGGSYGVLYAVRRCLRRPRSLRHPAGEAGPVSTASSRSSEDAIQLATWARESNPSLFKMLRTWVATVRSEMNRRVPICLLVRPSAINLGHFDLPLREWSGRAPDRLASASTGSDSPSASRSAASRPMRLPATYAVSNLDAPSALTAASLARARWAWPDPSCRRPRRSRRLPRPRAVGPPGAAGRTWRHASSAGSTGRTG